MGNQSTFAFTVNNDGVEENMDQWPGLFLLLPYASHVLLCAGSADKGV